MGHDAKVALSGKRILVVEDQPMISMLIEDILFDLGCVVVGPASNLARALEVASDEAFDAAILDVQLGQEDSLPLADILNRAGIPFAFATGYGGGFLPHEAPVLQKPYTFDGVSAIVSQLILSATPDPST